MIHQFILAAPRPELTVQEFQDYWVNVHAVKFASRIPQIQRYLIDTRIPFEGDLGTPALPHQGVAEIWLANEQDQVASLQSEEFLQGARPDEPNWAAFWLTIVIDTTAHEIVAGPPLTDPRPGWVKTIRLVKRRHDLPLAEYRAATLGEYASAVAGLPGLRRYLHCHTHDHSYVFGEPPLDSVEELWFDDIAALRAALLDPGYAQRVRPALAAISDPRYVFSLTARENWVMGPEPRGR